MLEAVLQNLNNWFERDRLAGWFRIEGGALALPDGFLLDGQFFRIKGSVFNDGLHQWPAVDLRDETFTGVVTDLAVPKAVQELAEEIAQWQADNGKAAQSPLQSESFGGYAYTKASGANGSLTWQDVFRSQLNRWRKL